MDAPYSMTIQHLVQAITDAARSMTPEEREQMRQALEPEPVKWKSNPHPDVLALTDEDYKWLRELKVKP